MRAVQICYESQVVPSQIVSNNVEGKKHEIVSLEIYKNAF
jgi:hypothetical protein